MLNVNTIIPKKDIVEENAPTQVNTIGVNIIKEGQYIMPKLKYIMPKLNKKQIENELRGKIAKQYTEKIAKLEDVIKYLRKVNAEYRTLIYKAEQEKLEMQDKLKQYEDWNNRLQEFMDMSDEDRKAYVKSLKKTNELNKAIERFGFYGKMLGTFFM